VGGSLKDLEVELALRKAVVTFPAGGARRVHPRPLEVYRPTPSADGSKKPPGPNRFDDPDHHYPVRYLAEQLSVCLLEVLARLSADPDTDAVLEQMTPGLDDPWLADLHDPEQAAAVEAFLKVNQVATFGPPPRQSDRDRLVDVFDPALLAALDRHHWIRQALERPQVVASHGDGGRVHLDAGLVRNPSRAVGRPITQLVSRLIIDILRRPGLRYYSRHGEGADAVCWALHGDLALPVLSVQPLDPDDDSHREAVQLVARRYRLPLPAVWERALTSVA
jgi:hypothetical protein